MLHLFLKSPPDAEAGNRNFIKKGLYGARIIFSPSPIFSHDFSPSKDFLSAKKHRIHFSPAAEGCIKKINIMFREPVFTFYIVHV